MFSALACALLFCMSWVVACLLNLCHCARLLPQSCVVTYALDFTCVQNLWHYARLLPVSCVVTHVLDFVSRIYGTVPGCCLYPALLLMFWIFACVLNLWHCARLLPLYCVVTHLLDFLPVSWIICPVLSMAWVVKRVLSPTALYKPGVNLITGVGGEGVHELFTHCRLYAVLSHSPEDDIFASLECWPTSIPETFMSARIGRSP